MKSFEVQSNENMRKCIKDEGPMSREIFLSYLRRFRVTAFWFFVQQQLGDVASATIEGREHVCQPYFQMTFAVHLNLILSFRRAKFDPSTKSVFYHFARMLLAAAAMD
jgi:hypothetical protein